MRRLSLALLAVALVAVPAAQGPAAAAAWPPAATATPRLPDLGMARLGDFSIDTSTGARLLRFTAEIVNVGTGPFELKGVRSNTSAARMRVRQRLFNTDGTKSQLLTPAAMLYAGDGHDHWHVQDLERYTLHQPGGGAELRRGAKAGFCFSDNAPYRLSLPRAPSSSVYRSCGTQLSTKVTMGLSVGWGDLYQSYLAFQWIDVGGLPSGDYVVKAAADPQAMFTEATTANNFTWTKIHVTDANVVTVLEQGPVA